MKFNDAKKIESDPEDFETEFIDVTDKVMPDVAERTLSSFSGMLIIPTGELVKYVHLGYASEYDQNWLLKIVNGKQEKKFDFSQKEFAEFREQQFDKYKKLIIIKKRFASYLIRAKKTLSSSILLFPILKQIIIYRYRNKRIFKATYANVSIFIAERLALPPHLYAP